MGGGERGREGEEESVGALPAVTEKLYKEGFGRSLYISYSVVAYAIQTLSFGLDMLQSWFSC